MSGSPPQIDTIGAPHSSAAPRQSSSDIMSLIEVEYSRIRPQPVQVRLQVCNGSSCRTVANFSVPRSFRPIIYAAILLVRASGNLIKATIVTRGQRVSIDAPLTKRTQSHGVRGFSRKNRGFLQRY